MPKLEQTFFDPISEKEMNYLDPSKVDFDNQWLD